MLSLQFFFYYVYFECCAQYQSRFLIVDTYLASSLFLIRILHNNMQFAIITEANLPLSILRKVCF